MENCPAKSALLQVISPELLSNLKSRHCTRHFASGEKRTFPGSATPIFACHQHQLLGVQGTMATGTVALEPPKGKLQCPPRSRSRMDRVFGNHAVLGYPAFSTASEVGRNICGAQPLIERDHMIQQVAPPLPTQRSASPQGRRNPGRTGSRPSLGVAHGTRAVSRLGECGHQDSEARPRGRPNERPMPMPSELHQVPKWIPQETDASRVQQCPGLCATSASG